MEYNSKFKTYSIILFLLALAFIAHIALSAKQGLPWVSIIFFGAIVWVSESLGVDLPKAGAISITFAIIFAAILLFDPLVVVLISFFTVVVWRDIRDRTSIFRWILNFSVAVFDAGLASLVYYLMGGTSIASKGGFTYLGFSSMLLPLILSAIVYFLINTILVSVAIGLYLKTPPTNIWMLNARWTIPGYLTLAPLGIVMAQLYVTSGPSAVALVVTPLLLARESFKIYMKLRAACGDTVRALVASIEAKDDYTRGHSEREADYIELVARKMKFPENEIDLVKYAALLHDLGKIGIPRRISCKPSPLTSDEYESIKKYSDIGVSLLKEVEFLKNVLPVVESHHKYNNGIGYGSGIKGESIPLLAKVVSVADAFDAMTSKRAYREAMSFPEAAAELLFCAGSQFDYDVVKQFIEMLEEEGKIEPGSVKPKQGPVISEEDFFKFNDEAAPYEEPEKKKEERPKNGFGLDSDFNVKDDLLIIDDWDLE